MFKFVLVGVIPRPPTFSEAVAKGEGERGSPEIVAMGLFVFGGTNPLIRFCTVVRRVFIQLLIPLITVVRALVFGYVPRVSSTIESNSACEKTVSSAFCNAA